MISYLSNSKLLSVHEPISGFYSVAIVYIFIYYTLLICLGTWQEKDPLIPSHFYINIKMFQVLYKKFYWNFNWKCTEFMHSYGKNEIYNIKVSSP